MNPELCRVQNRNETLAAMPRPNGPIPGDVVALGILDLGIPVSWLLVEPEGDRVLCVPADTMPLEGTFDIQQGETEPDGRLTFRCNQSYWVPRSMLVEASLVGCVSGYVFRDVRYLLQGMMAGDVERGASRREVDTDPEYLAWASYLARVVEKVNELDRE